MELFVTLDVTRRYCACEHMEINQKILIAALTRFFLLPGQGCITDLAQISCTVTNKNSILTSNGISWLLLVTDCLWLFKLWFQK